MQFNVQRSSGQLKRILILLAAFLLFSLLAFYLGGREFGVPLLLLSLVAAAYIGVDQGRVGWRYEVDENGLTVRRTIKRYTIAATSVDTVTPVTAAKVAGRIESYRSGSHREAKGNKQVALGRLVGFGSLPIPLDGSQPDPDATYVLVTLKTGREYILTPADPDRFVKALRDTSPKAR